MTPEDVPRHPPVTEEDVVDANAEAMLNLSLLDPPRYGWCAAGGLVDVLPPHERARRKSTRDAYLETRKRRGRNQALRIMEAHCTSASTQRRNAEDDAVRTEALNGSVSKSSQTKTASIAKGVELRESAVPETAGPASTGARKALVPLGETQTSVPSLGTNSDPQPQSGDMNSKCLPSVCTQIDRTVGEENSGERAPPSCADSSVEELLSGRQGDGPEYSDIKTPSRAASAASSVDKAENSVEISPLGSDEQRKPTGSGEQPKCIEVKAVSRTGTLDMYTYHRGREGLEPRDKKTGDLLCDLERTDSNYGWNAPKLAAMITVSFPLTDPQDDEEPQEDLAEQKVDSDSQKNVSVLDIACCSESHGTGTQSSREKHKRAVPQFKETVRWDLSDPRTPTALAFASGIAVEFGLNYGQTLDLAGSIQRQIDDFVRANVAYNAPISLKDPYGNERGFTPLIPPGFSTTPQLYGGHTASGQAGKGQHHPAGKHRMKSGPSAMGGGKRVTGKVRSDPEQYDVVPSHLLPKHDGPLPVKGGSRSGSRLANGVTFTSDPECRIEVLRRAKAESSAEVERISRAERDDGLVGVVTHERNHVCHICHARKAHAAQFPCGIPSHAFCDFHCATRLGFSIEKPTSIPVLLNHCPICSLECVCPKCTRRLDSVSHDFKKRSLKDGTKVEDTVFPSIIGTNNRPQKGQPNGPSSRKRDFASQNSQISDRVKKPIKGSKSSAKKEARQNIKIITVPKAPASEFPREVCAGRDMDPGTFEDYQTVFTGKGNFICQKDVLGHTVDGTAHKSAESTGGSDPEQVEEDGNVDYCHVCRKAGNLLCCDRCPRAFHRECIDSGALPDEEWECHVCVREKNGLADDLVDGKASLDSICTAFVDFDYSDGFVSNVQILSMIHEMVKKLIEYEFGELFRLPVDCDDVPGYKELIKNPMDLGTIGSNLINGVYAKRFEANKSWDDVIGAVLKDVELVWHNCFMYNREGSSIYRMAGVHRRRSHMIRKHSFDHLLSSRVKRLLEDYVVECEEVRGTISRAASLRIQRNSNRRTSARHKITLPCFHGGTSRMIAVFDPDTGMIVKIYSRMRGAALAAMCLSELGYKSEYSPISDYLVKGIIHRSSKDASQRLFGYRWLFLDDLRNGLVKFDKEADREYMSGNGAKTNRNEPSAFVEMVDGDRISIFASVAEAMSCPDLPEDIPVELFRRKVLGHPPGEPFSFAGRSWRRLLPKNAIQRDSEKISPDSDMAGEGGGTGVALCPSSGFGVSHGSGSFREDGLEPNFPPNVVIAKEDLISRRKLLGFESVKSAYQDWLATLESTPVSPAGESTDIEYFRLYYLDGDRNIDGVVWRTLRQHPIEQRNGISASAPAQQDPAIESCKAGRGTEISLVDQRCAPAPHRVSRAGEIEGREEGLPPSEEFAASLGRNAVAEGNAAREGRLPAKTRVEDGVHGAALHDRSMPIRKGDTEKDILLHEGKEGFSSSRHPLRGESMDRHQAEIPRWGEVPLQANGAVSTRGLEKQGVKRSHNPDGGIDESRRVAKKMAIRSA